MGKTFLYIRGRGQEAQRAALQAEFPAGEICIEPTRGGIPGAERQADLLNSLIANAGRGDLIAATSLEAMPEINADVYITLCSKGASLHIQQQPCLDSEIFSPEITSPEAGHGSRQTERTAARIIERQLAAERSRIAAQKEGRSAAIKAGQERTGNRGGHSTGSRPAGVAAEKEVRIKAYILDLVAQGQTQAQIVKTLEEETGELHLARNTAYKYMKTLQAQETQEA